MNDKILWKQVNIKYKTRWSQFRSQSALKDNLTLVEWRWHATNKIKIVKFEALLSGTENGVEWSNLVNEKKYLKIF